MDVEDRSTYLTFLSLIALMVIFLLPMTFSAHKYEF